MQRIEPPSQADDTEALVDYLELYALVHGRSQVRTVIDDLRIQTDVDFDLIDQNAGEDAAMAEIERVVEERARHTGDHYPFTMSDRADEVVFIGRRDGNLTHGQEAYVTCLLISGFRRLAGGWDPELDELKVQMHQRVFQLLATIAVAGLSGRSAITLGWPRREGEEILAALARGYMRGSGVQPKQVPSAIARARDKDGGVDALGWSVTGPAAVLPNAIWWAQVASGRGWRDKAVKQDATYFLQAYVDSAGQNQNYVTIIPFSRISETPDPYIDFMHGKVLDRNELPSLFSSGLALSDSGIDIDEVQHLAELAAWNTAMIAEIT